MPKKKFDLTSDIINVDLGEANAEESLPAVLSQSRAHRQQEVEAKNKNVLLTFSVEEAFRKEYKIWCARKGLKMNEAFIKGFELLKQVDYT
ncbi:MAG: hypothetical protein COA94_09270 [Rickettsiales bacterium]|nr:MAG: hypothetical protein COA94_09270 [Rickettsiales bacterium]